MKPPYKLLVWLLDVLCPESRPDLKGDFLEHYDQNNRDSGRGRANLKLLGQTLSVIPFLFIVKEKSSPTTTPAMFHTNLKIAKRTLAKNRLYSFINVFGLSVSLAVCIIITLFVRDELSYDKHFANHEHIFRIAGNFDQGGPSRISSAITSYLVAPLVEENKKDIDAIVRLDFRTDLITVNGDKKYMESGILYADSTFFDVFALPFASGDPATVLDDPSGVVLDETTAKKYFPDQDAIGKSVSLNDKPFMVTGVMKDMPHNSHFTARIIFPISGIKQWYPDWVLTNASGTSVYTYIKTSSNFQSVGFVNAINKSIASRWGSDKPPVFFLQPLESIHLESNLNYEVGTNGSKTTVYVFSLIALIILVLACINYINLSIAGSLQRTREVGVKRILGSTGRMQVSQFQTESLIVMIVSLLGAGLITILAMPLFNEITGKHLESNWLKDIPLAAGVIITVIIVSLLAGSFPAMNLLRMGTINMLSGNLSTGKRKSIFRSTLIVFQFSISITLIASTLIVMKQIHFIRHKDLGVNTDQLILIPFQGNDFAARFDVLRNEMLKNASILGVAASSNKVTQGTGGWRPYMKETSQITIPTVAISHTFFETMGAKMAEGRAFSPEFPSDAHEAYIVNESGARFLELKNPVGAPLFGMAFTGAKWTEKHATIVGVVKDFNLSSLHSPIGPVVFALGSDITEGYSWMEVRIASKNGRETIDYLRQLWNKTVPEGPFQFEFMDDSLQQNYLAEEQFLKVFLTFAILSIVIGSLGLFGLTAFMTRRRTKEVGIRKIVGASNAALVGLLSKDFLILVLISNLIGWPIAYYFMNGWLQNFAYRTTISAWLFIVTGIATVTVAFAAILYHSLKTSIANPVNALRHE